jgi:hypothetical protein
VKVALAALRTARGDSAEASADDRATPPIPEVVRTIRPRGVESRPTLTVGTRAWEGRLLEVLDSLAEGSPDGYADMDELTEGAARHGIEGERMEELLNDLLERGTLEEPLVGKFRRAEGPPRE